MDMQEYIERMKKNQELLLKYIDGEEGIEENYQNLTSLFDDQNISANREDLKTIIYMIIAIANNHYRSKQFFSKFEQILKYLQDSIKRYFTNSELFNLFKSNKRLLLFLIEERMVTINKSMILEMLQEKMVKYKYPEYFSPEIKELIDDEIRSKCRLITNDYIQRITGKKEEDFDIKRKNGQNDDQISQMIRNDQIEEFIIYVNKNDYPLESCINESIFETNSLLMKKKSIKLVEYAAFFGSTQIFMYLCKNGVQLDRTIWNYAIHGNEEEIIRYIKENVIEDSATFEDAIKESIKSHHNHIVNYILGNFVDETYYDNINFEYNFDRNIVSYSFHYHNFAYITNVQKNIYFLFYACEYDYLKIVKYIMESSHIDVSLKCAAKNNNQDILKILLNTGIKEIVFNCFAGCKKLTEIEIPNSVTSIKKFAFYKCASLTEITIPSTVNEIGNSTFRGCSSLLEINIPSSVKEIGNSVFNGCSSLKKITIPTSVTSIGDSAFNGCKSLIEIVIPPAVNSIENSVFYGCSALKKITIPPNLESIKNYAFYGCSSLKIVTIPNSVKSIGERAFFGCTSLRQLTIPRSVTSIGINAFEGCNYIKVRSFTQYQKVLGKKFD